MKFGLSEKDFNTLDQHLIQPLKYFGARVFVFGSRVRGKHHPFSDIDILYCEKSGHPIPLGKIAVLKEGLEESNLPIKVDLVNEKDLAQSYRSNIEKEKVEI